jgi:hypothetical protein
MDIIKSLIDLITSIASLAASIIALKVIRDEKGKRQTSPPHWGKYIITGHLFKCKWIWSSG